MEERMKKKLKIGFMCSTGAIDCFWGALIFVICWLILTLAFKANDVGYMGIAAVVLCVLGMILFVVGRAIVGLQSRKINFQRRKTTPEEEWFLQEMMDVEREAAHAKLANDISKLTPGRIDDILASAEGLKIIKRYFAAGKIYMGKNKFLDHILLIIIIIAALICVIVNVL